MSISDWFLIGFFFKVNQLKDFSGFFNSTRMLPNILHRYLLAVLISCQFVSDFKSNLNLCDFRGDSILTLWADLHTMSCFFLPLSWLFEIPVLVNVFVGVGKSCLLLRFSDGSFTTSFITTIGFVFLTTLPIFYCETILAFLDLWMWSSLIILSTLGLLMWFTRENWGWLDFRSLASFIIFGSSDTGEKFKV